VARKLAADRIKDLEQMRRSKTLLGVSKRVALGPYAQHHLIAKSQAGLVTPKHLEAIEQQLSVALEHFGTNRGLDSISSSDVADYAAWLATRPTERKGGFVSPGTVRHYLNSLSNLYRRAQADGVVVPGFNPVSAMMEKPTARRREARWLEVHEAAEFLEAARQTSAGVPNRSPIYELVATFLLTGGRAAEVLGLTRDDINFDRMTVDFRPNEYRNLKTQTSRRVVPMWPQLWSILDQYVRTRKSVPTTPAESADPLLLFPSLVKPGYPIVDLRKSLDAVSQRLGRDPGGVRSRQFRHTYCAARLQTLDRGAPVAPYTVAKEMGHGGTQLVNRIYGHLGTIRHRSEVVEYV
jgi:integrase